MAFRTSHEIFEGYLLGLNSVKGKGEADLACLLDGARSDLDA